MQKPAEMIRAYVAQEIAAATEPLLEQIEELKTFAKNIGYEMVKDEYRDHVTSLENALLAAMDWIPSDPAMPQAHELRKTISALLSN